MTTHPLHSQPIPNSWDRRGLPGWTYQSQALFDLERDRRAQCVRGDRCDQFVGQRHAESQTCHAAQTLAFVGNQFQI